MSTASDVLNQILSTVSYPTPKAKLIEAARKQRADNSILAALRQIPDKNYTSSEDVQKVLSKNLNFADLLKQ
jgi:hypothetical protein